MEFEKLHVFFRRVSTKGQDIATQEAADLSYRESLNPDEVMIINENAVSANKKSINDRPEMQKIISLIKEDKVDTIYAFDRTRLFRDFYDGMEFTDLVLKHEVKIVFTSVGNGHLPASDNIFMEGLLSLFSDIEGKNIARRSGETRRRYPPQLLGYRNDKETKKYSKDSDKKEVIEQFFSALTEINTIDELHSLIKTFQKDLKCKSEMSLINMARNPFYAGHDLVKGINKLRHVDPYLSLETFDQLQKAKDELFKAYVNTMEQINVLVKLFSPTCGYCKKTLNYRQENTSVYGFFICSNKAHRKVKVKIPIIELQKIVEQVFQEVANKLDYKKLCSHSLESFKNIKRQTESEISIIELQIKEFMEEFLLGSNQYSEDWKMDPRYKKANHLKEEKQQLVNNLSQKEMLLENNKDIAQIVEKYLNNRSRVSLPLLYSLIIKQLIIYEQGLDIEVFAFDYLQNMQTELIYEGDESAWI
ncbi:recombinase family protein [Halobacillus rhizosphaerae]|uniref:recombinase family protein n=1 Tax=Halobacillus rhizosphaerae TaxID=3064889 RepID=UPI00398B19F3